MECEYCGNKFKTISSLNYHTTHAKYCLKIQNKQSSKFKCKYCSKSLSSKHWLNLHVNKCTHNITKIREDNMSIINENRELKIVNDMLETQLAEQRERYEKTIRDLQDKLENIAIKAVSQNFEDETTIEINEDDFLTDRDFTIEEETDTEEEYKQLPPLEVGKGYTIEHREEDGYINVTNLCKAGNKKFYGWHRLDKTKTFLRLLSAEAQICASALIKTNKGGNNKDQQCTWVHPQVAINIAQWISPAFDLKVSGWVYEIMMTGKVDITNTTSYKKLQEENKQKSMRIQYLTKKYVKSQPRAQYKERNVIYVLTTALMKKERLYILGKANNLTHRLSTYNKSDEHEVIYYQECGDEETMALVETTVFHQLKEYREQANRERFILPETEEIEFFTNTIKKSIEFFKK